MKFSELQPFIKDKIAEAKKIFGENATTIELCMYIYGVGLDDGAAGVKITNK